MPYAVRRLADTAEVWRGVRCRQTRDLGETVKNEEQKENGKMAERNEQKQVHAAKWMTCIHYVLDKLIMKKREKKKNSFILF